MANGFQRLIQKIVPAKWAQDMEAESRSWMVRCPNCGFEQSIWDMGGIRWKASGNNWTYMRCIQCRKRGKHIMERRTSA